MESVLRRDEVDKTVQNLVSPNIRDSIDGLGLLHNGTNSRTGSTRYDVGLHDQSKDEVGELKVGGSEDALISKAGGRKEAGGESSMVDINSTIELLEPSYGSSVISSMGSLPGPTAPSASEVESGPVDGSTDDQEHYCPLISYFATQDTAAQSAAGLAQTDQLGVLENGPAPERQHEDDNGLATPHHLRGQGSAAQVEAVPGVTTAVAPAIIPDYDITDEAYAESTSTSYVTSIASEISRGILENERLYPQYGQHSYGMPVDEAEMDRMDLQHRKYELVLGDKHFLAPIGPSPQRILDLGTGTGIWALDVADMFPMAEVIGVDIAPIQPKWVAPNCQFEIDDVEAEWTYRPESFDFIHFRDPLYVVRDWPRLMRQIYDHLKPGGWCELACIYPWPKCDDGTMPPDSGFRVICEKFIEVSYAFGAPADCPVRFTQYFNDAGFVDLGEHIFKVPSSPWPKDKRLKRIGALEMTNVVEGATAFGLRAFTQVFGWTKEEVEVAMMGFRRDVKNRKYHQYCEYFVVYGRKPKS